MTIFRYGSLQIDGLHWILTNNLNEWSINVRFFFFSQAMASNQGFEAGDEQNTVTNRTERRTPANGDNVPNEATTLAASGIQTYFVDEKVFIPEVDKVN